jgi:hypothetical protein
VPFSFTAIKYKIHDKELLAIINDFEEWHHLFEKAQHKTIVYSDHKNLQYFMIAHVLNQCQVQWALSLSRFWFIIRYRPGRQQRKLNAIFYHSYLAFKEGNVVYEQ